MLLNDLDCSEVVRCILDGSKHGAMKEVVTGNWFKERHIVNLQEGDLQKKYKKKV